MRTLSISKEAALEQRRWLVVDAEGKVLGRLASVVASVLRGKHKPCYAPHVDTGDFVIVVNAAKVKLTGRKEMGKIYYRHSAWVGSIKEETAGQLRERKPTELVRLAVKRMLPSGSMGRQMFSKLKIYAAADHPHEAQKPEVLAVG